MTESAPTPRWSFSCRDVGYSCEWQVRTSSVDELKARFLEHARCAHTVSPLPPELLARVERAARPV
ncbi:MAG: DUF1059 domain-containing protein [Thermoplasmata archaeon]